MSVKFKNKKERWEFLKATLFLALFLSFFTYYLEKVTGIIPAPNLAVGFMALFGLVISIIVLIRLFICLLNSWEYAEDTYDFFKKRDWFK